ncbi:protein REVEILLE 6-like isoform X2 [Impatiens glandulifera]|uniref:protein REVEILLE 6-like isoform X2 n=1 Tax=Impatiens glandulifera TaxID=253017 RepID=UPI001FB12125|nr:protein REVEILLE 6-like isoform X2 [Impatiens glandulifera]
MVSVNPSPADGLYLDPTGMPLPGIGSFSSTVPPTTSSPDDPSKKIRKPYTITKSRENWTEPEHDKFLEALQLFDRDWKKIEAFVGSKSVIQIRSHAQKYFLKVQKSGTAEHLPPPRPKRKASHPYPQKASKSEGSLPAPTSEPGFRKGSDCSSSLTKNPVMSTTDVASWTENSLQTTNLSHATKGKLLTNNCCSSTESTPRTRPTLEMTDQGNHGSSLRVLPDFAQVYRFIGSVFDPDATGHLQKLKKMDPIDVETVLLLMRNLSINLTSPSFEEHRKLLSSYEIENEEKDDCIARKKPPTELITS